MPEFDGNSPGSLGAEALPKIGPTKFGYVTNYFASSKATLVV